MAKKSDNNVRKFYNTNRITNNIGFVIFFVILIYVIINIFFYITSDSIAEYEVQQGRIASTVIYKGIVLRSEKVYYATQSGTVNYYIANATMVASGDTIYTIDTSGEIAEQISNAAADGTSLTTDAKLEIADELTDFAASYTSLDFSEVYTFKNSLNSSISQNLSAIALNSLGDLTADASDSFYRITASTPGIVLYYTDGYEDLTADDFTAEDLTGASCNKISYSSGRTAEAGDIVFKLVTSEDWSVIIPISDELAEELNDTTSLSVTFCKDNYTASASTTIWKKDGDYYLQLSFSTAMIRYANERYLELELAINKQEGLKIPNSAITSKEFFTVPIEYFLKGSDSGSLGLLVQKTTEDGELSTEFVSPTIYYSTDTAYYIDDTDVSSGDIILMSDSSEQYVIGTDTDSLPGVYNINKGYAVFKQINILYQNEEYAIVDTNTSYGIALYDHIALDGSAVEEDDFVN